MPRLSSRLLPSLLGAALLLAQPVTADAQTVFSVANEAQLRAALTAATNDDAIVFQNNIALTADLPAVSTSITIEGAGFTLSGGGEFRGLLVAAFVPGTGTPEAIAVLIQNLTIAETVAAGGTGGSGATGGGGGGGLGGALFVGSLADVTLSNVNLVNNAAAGGTGGTAAGAGGGGGGGMGGPGGQGDATAGGGGGGVGTGAAGGSGTPGSPGIVTGAAAGGEADGNLGGTGGGGGGSSVSGGAGGGVDGQPADVIGGPGGFGGGGGASVGGNSAGSGGLGGGGGGGDDGFGGYAGGGGGAPGGAPNPGGLGGGDGGILGGGGGGGAGLGGGIFLSPDASLTVTGGLTIDGNSVSPGLGASGGTDGAAGGAGIFLAGFGSLVFSPPAGITQTVSDSIADENGLFGPDDDLGEWTLVMDGDGTLMLSGDNRYSAGTEVLAGTLSVAAEANLGLGPVTLRNTATLALTSSAVFTQSLLVQETPLAHVAAGLSATWAGQIDDLDTAGQLGVTGGGTLTLTDAANAYSGGTRVMGSSTVRISDDGALGDVAGALTLGDAVSGGTLAVTTGSLFQTARFVSLGAGGGTFDIEGTADVTLLGQISGSGDLLKSGTGVLTLGGANTYTGATNVQGGVLRAGGATAFSAGAMTVGLSATLDLNGFSHAFGSLAGAGDVLLGAAQMTVGGDDASTLFSGGISGAGSLRKVGIGTLTLTGGNTYSGGTFVDQGTLAGNTTSLQGAIVNDAVVVFDQAAAGTYAGVMSGTGALVKTGGGALTLAGVNSYSGGTLVSAGPLIGSTASLQGAITNNALVVFDQAGAGSYAGIMSGVGSLLKLGAGTLTLTGTNTFSGGTGVGAGVLQAGDENVFGPGAMFVNGGATLDLSGFSQTVGSLAGAGSVTLGAGTLTTGGNNATTLFSGAISGAGGLIKTGTGTLVLTGANQYGGGTVVSGGSLIGHTGSLQGNILNNALVVFDQGFDGTFAGMMNGAGSLLKIGTGTLTLGGTSAYGGGTFISGNGAIAIASDGALGTGLVALGDAVSGGTLRFADASLFSSSRPFLLGPGGAIFDTAGSSSITLAGLVAGSGGLVKTGTGTLTLSGAGAYAGPTTLLEGVLRAGAADVFGTSGQMSVATGATLDLAGFGQSFGSIVGAGGIALGSAALTTGGDHSSSLFSGIISGPGSLAKTGSGTLFLTGANEYSGGTTVEDGTLAGDSTSLQGDIVNHSVVVFDQGFDGTYGGSMSGGGLLAKSGTGALTLDGTLSHTGGTIVTGGSLLAGLGTLRGLVLNDSSLTFTGDADGAFEGMLAGAGSYVKAGSGTMTVSGAHAMTGVFNVSAGTFAFDGLLGGGVNVAPGAAFHASGGVLGSVSVGGSLVAGGPLTGAPLFAQTSATPGLLAATLSLDEPRPPALTIGGNLLAAPGSVLSFPVGTGLSPSVLVGGSAVLNGTHLDLITEDIGDRRFATFLALTALDGLTVTDTSATARDPLVLPVLRHSAQSLFVTLLNMRIPLAGAVTNPNAASVGAAIDVLKLDATGDRLDVVRELTALDDGALNDALKDIAGEIYSSSVQLALLDSESFTDMLRDQLVNRTREAGAERGWGGQSIRWWVQLTGQRATFGGSQVVNGGFANLGGGGGGLDWRISERWLVGGGGGLGAGHMSLNGMVASTDFQAPRAFGYGGFKSGRFGLRAGGSAARSRATTERRVAFTATMPDDVGGDPLTGGIDRPADGREVSLVSDEWAETADNFKVKTYTVDSVIGLRRAKFSRRGLVEGGAGALALRLPDQALAFKQLDVRLNVFRHEGNYRPFFQSTFRRELSDGQIRTIAQFADAPGTDFEVAGIPIPDNLFAGRAGLTLLTILGEMTFQYQFRIAPGQRQHAGDFRIRW